MSALTPRRAVALWLFACTALVIAMVGVGGYTRLMRAGLSIVEWKPVTGALPPMTDAAWSEAFAAYQASPEGKLINATIDLEGFKSIFFIEWFHRLLGRFIGVFFFLPWAFFMWRKIVTPKEARVLLGWFAAGGFQGALGWFMVKSGLVDVPHVSHLRLTLHLVFALFVAMGLLWTALSYWTPRPVAPQSMPTWPSRLLLGLVLVTVVWGGFMAGLHAGLVSDTFPLMFGALVPANAWEATFGWTNPFQNVVTVHFLHRWLAVATVGVAVWAWHVSRRMGPLAARAGWAVLAFALLQLSLGLATIWLHVPVWLAGWHQVNGACLLLSATALVFASPSAIAAIAPGPAEASGDAARA